MFRRLAPCSRGGFETNGKLCNRQQTLYLPPGKWKWRQIFTKTQCFKKLYPHWRSDLMDFWSKDCSASWAGRHLLSSPWRLLLMLEISICWKAILASPSLSPWVVHNSQIVKSKLILYAIWSRWSKGHFSENRGMVSLDPEVPCRDTDPCREDNKVVFRHRPCHHNCDHHYHLHDGIYLLVNNSSIWLLLAFWKH